MSGCHAWQGFFQLYLRSLICLLFPVVWLSVCVFPSGLLFMLSKRRSSAEGQQWQVGSRSLLVEPLTVNTRYFQLYTFLSAEWVLWAASLSCWKRFMLRVLPHALVKPVLVENVVLLQVGSCIMCRSSAGGSLREHCRAQSCRSQ